jgi:branched-chain amino acid transport system ATP-binding protein
VRLTVAGLSARYGGNTVLRDIDLKVQSGEVLALIGANGAGKSTLLTTIAGLHRQAAGSVRLDDRELLGVPAARIAGSGLALVLEGRHLFGELTVVENLAMGMNGRGYSAAQRAEQVDCVFAMFPILQEFSRRRAGLLSGGQQQMLAIGRALVRQPQVLLLDEPSLGLAPLLVTQILDTVRGLADGGVAVVLSEQNAAAALRVASHGLVIDNGRIVRSDTSAALLADEEISRHYLGAGDSEQNTPEGSDPGTAPAELPASLRRRSLRG